MIDTKNFKTRSEIVQRQMPRVLGNNQFQTKTVVSLDGGYGSVNGVGPSRVFCYPSYAKKAPEGFEVVGSLSSASIIVKDNVTGQQWLVGEAAEELMDQNDLASTTDGSIYTRYRYGTEMFKVLMGTGIALGLMGEDFDSDGVYLQTGLPSEYCKGDSPKLVAALVGDYSYDVKIGNASFKPVRFSLTEDRIGIMEQPMGTLCSLAYNNGETTKFGERIMSSATLVDDTGFETEDVFSIIKGKKTPSATFTDTGMRAVFEEAISKMKKDYPGLDTKVFEFQKYLESGRVPFFDISEFKMNYAEIPEYLEEANTSLCEKSVVRLVQEYGELKGYRYLVVTGGTGESRFEQIKKKLALFEELEVVPGNYNTPDLPYAYSNAIGYYMYRIASLSKEAKRG